MDLAERFRWPRVIKPDIDVFAVDADVIPITVSYVEWEGWAEGNRPAGQAAARLVDRVLACDFTLSRSSQRLDDAIPPSPSLLRIR
jgi:hypothetical protein